MKHVQLNIPQLFDSSVTNITQRIAGFSMEIVGDSNNIPVVEVVGIQSKGVFVSNMVFQLEQTLVDAILKGMKGKELEDPEIRNLYLGEYINIVSGHVLTAINNQVGEISRLTLPQVGTLSQDIGEAFGDKCVICFASLHGRMRVEVDYELCAAICDLA